LHRLQNPDDVQPTEPQAAATRHILLHILTTQVEFSDFFYAGKY
jgi:hypothetical protein